MDPVDHRQSTAVAIPPHHSQGSMSSSSALNADLMNVSVDSHRKAPRATAPSPKQIVVKKRIHEDAKKFIKGKTTTWRYQGIDPDALLAGHYDRVGVDENITYQQSCWRFTTFNALSTRTTKDSASAGRWQLLLTEFGTEDVLFIQSTNENGYHQENVDTHIIFKSGASTWRPGAGVALVFKRESFKGERFTCTHASERIIAVKYVPQKGGKNFTFISGYAPGEWLDTDDEVLEREDFWKKIRDLVSGDGFVVLGIDANGRIPVNETSTVDCDRTEFGSRLEQATPNGREVLQLAADFDLSILNESNGEQTICGSWCKANKASDNNRIDYILARGLQGEAITQTLKTARVHRRSDGVVDHVPLAAKVHFDVGRTTDVPRRRLKLLDEHVKSREALDHIEKELKKLNVDGLSLQKHYDLINKEFLRIQDELHPKPRSTRLPWIDSHLLKLIDIKAVMIRKLVNSRGELDEEVSKRVTESKKFKYQVNQEGLDEAQKLALEEHRGVLAEYWSACNNTKNALKEARDKWLDDKTSEAIKASKTGNWSRVYQIERMITGRKAKKRHLPPHEDQCSHANKLFGGNSTEPKDSDWAVFNAGRDLVAERVLITTDEVVAALKTIKSGKAVHRLSPDYSLLKALTRQQVNDYLTPLLQKIVDEERQLPSAIKSADLFWLFKKGSPTMAENYRTIGLRMAITQVLAAIIQNRCAMSSRVGYQQHGYRSKHDRTHAIFNLRQQLYRQSREGDNCMVVLWDLRQFFDRLSRLQLLHELQEMKVDKNIISIIMKLLHQAKYTIINEDHIVEILTLAGVLQGGKESPSLSMPAMEVILRELRLATITSLEFGFLKKEATSLSTDGLKQFVDDYMKSAAFNKKTKSGACTLKKFTNMQSLHEDLDPGNLAYADDLSQIIIVNEREEARSMINMMGEVIEGCGHTVAYKKLEVMFLCKTEKAKKEFERGFVLDNNHVVIPQKGITYLGEKINAAVSCSSEVSVRINLSNSAFRGFAGKWLWRNSGLDIDLILKMWTACSRCYLTEALAHSCIGKTSLRKMESTQTRQLSSIYRCKMGRGESLTKLPVNGRELREAFKVQSIASVLMKRRLSWLRSLIVEGPLLASAQAFEPLENNGITPWQKMWCADIEMLHRMEENSSDGRPNMRSLSTACRRPGILIWGSNKFSKDEHYLSACAEIYKYYKNDYVSATESSDPVPSHEPGGLEMGRGEDVGQVSGTSTSSSSSSSSSMLSLSSSLKQQHLSKLSMWSFYSTFISSSLMSSLPKNLNFATMITRSISSLRSTNPHFGFLSASSSLS